MNPSSAPPGMERGRPRQENGPATPTASKIQASLTGCVCGAYPHPEPARDPDWWAANIREIQGWPATPPQTPCTWCGAEPGVRCRPATGRTSRRYRQILANSHPSRLEVAS